MVRPALKKLSGTVEVDDKFLAGKICEYLVKLISGFLLNEFIAPVYQSFDLMDW